MKIYCATITTGDKWEISTGVICISGKNKKDATEQIEQRIGSNKIVTIQILSPKIKGVLFEQSPVIE